MEELTRHKTMKLVSSVLLFCHRVKSATDGDFVLCDLFT